MNVNVTAENTKTTKAGKLYVGGTFSDNKTTSLLNRDGNTLNTITDTYKEVNPKVLGAMSKYFNNPGGDMLHEVTESYQGAVISRRLGKDAGFASQEEDENFFAHNNATPQTSTNGYQQINYDKNGNQTDVLYKSGKAEAIFKDPTGEKNPLTIKIYP